MTFEMFLWPLVGGALIGLAGTILLLANGRIAGISGIFGGLLRSGVSRSSRSSKNDLAWRAAFVAGLVLGGIVLLFALPSAYPTSFGSSWALVGAAGLLVGFGTRFGNGCTSGHGVCGISRFSPRSLLATGTFIVTGALAVFALRHVFGG